MFVSKQDYVQPHRIYFFFYRLCGYIVSTAPEVYVCHVFQCAPNAASLTKALAEACQVNNSFMLRNSL